MKVFNKIGVFRGDSALSSWISRIHVQHGHVAGRLVFCTARAAEFSSRATGDDGEPRDRPSRQVDVADWSGLADDLMLKSQLRTRLAAALEDLPEIYRVPVVLRHLEGFTTEEASSMLRVNGQTLKSRLHRGRLILRDRLAAFGDGLSLHRPMAFPRARAASELAPAA